MRGSLGAIREQAATIKQLQGVLLANHPEPALGPAASSVPNTRPAPSLHTRALTREGGGVQLARELSGQTTRGAGNGWGEQFTVSEEYKGPHVRWPLTLDNVQQASLPPLPRPRPCPCPSAGTCPCRTAA